MTAIITTKCPTCNHRYVETTGQAECPYCEIASLTIERDALRATIEADRLVASAASDVMDKLAAQRDAAVAECERLTIERDAANTNLDDTIGQMELIEKDRDAAVDLVRHCWIHSGYKQCGYDQMTTDEKALFDSITWRTDQ